MPRTLRCSLALALIALGLPACSSEAEAPDALPRVAEAVTVAASAEARAELGVVVWGAEARQGGDLHMAGYASDGAVAFTVDQRTIMVDETHHTFETAVGGRENARMRLDGTLGALDPTGHFEIALETSENGFPASPLAARAVVLAQLDLATTGSEAPAPASLVTPASLGPLAEGSLVSTCSPLLRSCAGSLARAGAPLVPCVMATVQVGSVLLCAAAGAAVGGPVGALEAGAVCGIRQQGAVIKNGMECAERARSIYESWRSRLSDVVSSCRNAASGCTGGSSDAATSSIAAASSIAPAP